MTLITILLGIAGLVILVLLAYLLVEIIRLLASIRRVATRVENLTDVWWWMDWVKAITPFFRRKKA